MDQTTDDQTLPTPPVDGATASADDATATDATATGATAEETPAAETAVKPEGEETEAAA